MYRHCKALFAVSTLIVSLVLIPPVHAKTFNEPDIKAAFLYYFLHFISWPENDLGNKTKPYKLCTLGESSVTRSLELILASPKAVNIAVEVHVISKAAQATECNYVYIGPLSNEYAAPVIALTRKNSILTVSDNDGFAKLGGMIEMKRKAKKVTVTINLEALTADGLKASSKLLNLADIVSTPNFQGATNVPAE